MSCSDLGPEPAAGTIAAPDWRRPSDLLAEYRRPQSTGRLEIIKVQPRSPKNRADGQHSMIIDLKGRKAVVTGSTGGIGRASSKA
jgi:hypothetical protein